MFLLTRRRFREHPEPMGVFHSSERAMDGRRGPWRETATGVWTTANAEHGSEFISPKTGTARTYIYGVRAVPVLDPPTPSKKE